MAITASLPALKILPDETVSTLTFETTSINAAALIITISIILTIDIGVITPSAPAHDGLSDGIAPKRTITHTDRRNMPTEILAVLGIDDVAIGLVPSLIIFTYSGSFSFSLNIGSSLSSTPILLLTKAATITPIRVAGIQIFRMSKISIPCGANKVARATVAAVIGLAVMACWDAITEIPRGRSGRTPVLAASSEMIGNIE